MIKQINKRMIPLIIASCAFSIPPSVAQVGGKTEVDNFSLLPASEACRRLDFENVEIVPGFVNDTWFAVVSGAKPWLTMQVDLRPRIYIDQPDYWGIEVVGCLNGMGLPAKGKYSTSMQVNGMGKLGVEVIGATTSKKLKVPPQ